MIEAVSHLFTFLRYPEVLIVLGGASRWNRTQIDEALTRTVVRRRTARLRPRREPGSRP